MITRAHILAGIKGLVEFVVFMIDMCSPSLFVPESKYAETKVYDLTMRIRRLEFWLKKHNIEMPQ